MAPSAPTAVAPIPANTSRLFTATGPIVDQPSREAWLRRPELQRVGPLVMPHLWPSAMGASGWLGNGVSGEARYRVVCRGSWLVGCVRRPDRGHGTGDPGDATESHHQPQLASHPGHPGAGSSRTDRRRRVAVPGLGPWQGHALGGHLSLIHI